MDGDPTRLRQILVNLVGNAIKFTERGEVLVSVQAVSGSPPLVTLRIEVHDTGIGIGPEDRTRLFESFSQTDGSDSRKYGGTGLGLAICKQLSQMMGGDVGVETQKGKGSTFWFTVRLEALAGAADGGFAALGQKRLLIVDDNASARSVFSAQAASWGLSPHEAASGAAALEVLRRSATEGNPFDVALVDARMPDLNGLELIGGVMEAGHLLPTARVILLGYAGDRQARQAAAEMGVTRSLTKPVRRAQLLRCPAGGFGRRAADFLRTETRRRPQRRSIASTPRARPNRRRQRRKQNGRGAPRRKAWLHVRLGRQRPSGAGSVSKLRVRRHPDGCANAGDGRTGGYRRDPA